MYCTKEKNKSMEEKENREEILQVYYDLRDFFDAHPDDQKKRTYLLTIVPKEDLEIVIHKLLIFFQESEEYEKCKKLTNWKKTL
jgi:hypothetical protein